MKVAFFVDHFPSESQTFVWNQIEGVMAAGVDVTVLALRRGSGEEESRNIPAVHFLSERPGARRNRARLVIGKLLGAQGARQRIALVKALNPWRFGRKALSLEVAADVARLPRGGMAFDIIHCQFGMLGAMAVELRKTGALAGRIVTSFRGFDTQKQVEQRPDLYRELFKHGDMFLPVCEHFAAWLVQRGCPVAKIRVLYSGIDCSRFSFRRPSSDAGNALRVLSVARLVPKKGIEDALHAVAVMKKSNRSVHYTVVGDGPLGPALRRRAADLGLNGTVSFTGWQNHDKVAEHMERADVLLAPSRTSPDGDMEGIPNVLKEAMARGLAVVSTRHSGIPELVKHGKNGLLADENDPEERYIKCNKISYNWKKSYEYL